MTMQFVNYPIMLCRINDGLQCDDVLLWHDYIINNPNINAKLMGNGFLTFIEDQYLHTLFEVKIESFNH